MGRRDGQHIEMDWSYEDPRYEVVRGHVTSETFTAALRKHDVQVDPPGDREHVWMRANPDPSGEFSCHYALCEPQRGAFRATIRRYPIGYWTEEWERIRSKGKA